MRTQTGAVIIAYNPNLNQFINVITAALEQTDCLVIVNNSQKKLSFFSELLPPHLVSRFNIIENGDNLGVAMALNYGIKFLIKKNCSHLIFLDQDSIIPEKMVYQLRDTFVHFQLKGVKIAAVGPSFFDTSLQKLSPFINFKEYGYEFIFGNSNKPIVPAHLLITSGTFTSVEVVNDVGLMEVGLFIDCVDHEWCLRAISKGYELLGDTRVIMEHTIGDEPIIFRNKKFHKHSPLRHYYIARNTVHLLKRKYIPFKWRLNMLLSTIKLFIFYSLIDNNKLEHFQMMLRGFYHGIVGKIGRYDLV